MFVLILSMGLILSFLDLVPLFKKKEWTTFVLYSLLLITALVLGVLYTFNVTLPNPALFLRKLTTILWRKDFNGD